MNKIHYTSGHFYIEKDGKKIKIANPELLYPLTIYGEMQFVDLPKELSVEIKDACDSDCCTMDGACGSNCRSPLKVAILSKSSSPEIPDSSWIDFDKSKGSNQKLPPVKKYVACQKKSLNDRFPDPIVIGYLKYAAGDVECPNFITPGAIGHGEVYRWCDCIADDFEWPSPPTVAGTSTDLKSDLEKPNNSEKPDFEDIAEKHFESKGLWYGELTTWERAAIESLLKSVIIPRDKTIYDLRESLKASERFRAEDAASAIAEANRLRERVKELEETLTKCEKTFGILSKLFNTLEETPDNEMPRLIEEVDIDFELIQAKIKDQLKI